MKNYILKNVNTLNHWIYKFCNLLLLFVLSILFSSNIYGQTVWYSYQSGDWSEWRTWTTDPSGTTLINPSSSIPSAAVNNSVVILNGRTVTIQTGVGVITTTSFTIQEGAVLDLTTNINAHNFGVFSGSGKLRLSTAIFPSFASGSFVQAGGGTVEYSNMGGFTLNQYTYNNLIIKLNNSSDEVLFNSTDPFTVNGNITIEKGILRVGDNISTNQKHVYFNGDVTVNPEGQIGVGFINVGNSTSYDPLSRSHQIYIKGSLYNLGGTVRFTNMTAPVYNTVPPSGLQAGWSDVIFNNENADQHVVCNGTTVFYRIQVAKGIDKTYILNIDADADDKFFLYGRNDRQTDNNPASFGSGLGSPDIDNLNALAILSGTCRLGNNISLPALSSRYYVLDEDACLWLDGSRVRYYTSSINAGFYLYGMLKLTNNGLLNMDDATASFRRGIVTREASSIIVDNSTIQATLIRTSSLSSSHRGAFIVSGNSVITLSGNNSHGYHATLSFGYPDNAINISGGTINILHPTFPTTDLATNSNGTNFSVLFGSIAKNINITGGTFNISIPDGSNAYVNSTVPFYNLNISGTNSTNDLRVVEFVNPASSSAPPSLTPQPLVVLNNLNIQSNAVLNTTVPAADVNVVVGNDFTIGSSGIYNPGLNTTLFNGTDAQTFDIQGDIAGNLNNLTIDRSGNLVLNNANVDVPVVINADFRINNGCTFTDNGRILEVHGNIYNSGTHFKPATGAGSIRLSGITDQIINGDGTGIFNNLTLNKAGGSVALHANTTIAGDLRLANAAARLNIGLYNLKFTATGDVFDDINGTGKNFRADRMILSSGLMTDGGVSKVYSNTEDFLFPFGFSNAAGTVFYYLPATIRYSSTPATYGTVTSRPVNSRHPLAQTNNSLACYWNTSSSGFSGVPANSVVHEYTYDPLSDNFVSGNESDYFPAVYRNGSINTWQFINNPVLVNDGNNTVTYDTAYTADGEYTAGEADAFAVVPVLYSTGNDGDWDSPATWSTEGVGGTAGTSVPGENTIVVIGDDSHNHTVTVNQNSRACGSLTIYKGSVLDLKNYTGHNFEKLPDNGVNAKGTLRIASSNYFPNGDFGAFIGETGGTVEYYTFGATDVSIPLTSDVTGLVLDHYFNLNIIPASGRTISLPNSDLIIYNNLTKDGEGQVNTNNNAIHKVSIRNDFEIVNGIFEVKNNAVHHIIVAGDMNVSGTFRVQNGDIAVDHVLELYNNLTGSGPFITNAGGKIKTFFKGENSASIRGGDKNFYAVEVNKGSDQLPVLNVRANITSSTDPAMVLRNGTLRIKQGTLILSGTQSYTIPETSCLSIDSVADVTLINAGIDSTLFLIGKLEMLGGSLKIGNTGNANRNSIEYSSEGSPEIVVYGGILNVKSQIKRNSRSTFGALKYSQQGGIVEIHGVSQDVTRSKFEICNEGSYFEFTNGTINIYRGGGVDFGDVYLRPAHSNIAADGILAFVPENQNVNQYFNIDATCSLGSLFIDGADNNDSAVVKLMVNPLVLLGDLTINDEFSRLYSNNLNVSIARNVTINGKYTTGSNITSFFGGNAQEITLGINSTFNKLIVDKVIGSDVTFIDNGSFQPVIADSLIIKRGTLTNAGGLNILALGNIVNNGIHTSTGSGSLTLQGFRNQLIDGNGSGQFGNLNLTNGAANGATLMANMTVNGVLTLTSGSLYVNDYLLTLSTTSAIAGTPGIISNNNWITSNGVISDLGIRKEYPAASPASFTFPIGVPGKYTPVTYDVTFSATSPGSITVKPVNCKFPALTNSSDDELQYYWNVSSTPFGGLSSVTHTYNYLQGDVRGTETSYAGARYFSGAWTNLGTSVIDPEYNTIILTQEYIDGEYTCGIPGNFLIKPAYYSYDNAPGIATGADWNTAGTWATGDHSGTPATVPPDGNPIIIKSGHRINVSDNDRMTYSVRNDGILNLGISVGHNFGHFTGGGRLIVSNTSAGQFVFPGGDYAGFMNSTGSTVEYNGSTTTVPGSILPIQRTYQNIEFTGIVSKYMSNVNLLVRGNLLITESQLSNTFYDKNINLGGNWTDDFNNGFLPGKGLVAFEGASLQRMKPAGNEHFHNLEINNAAGLVLEGPAEIAHWLYLTNGHINTTDDNLLTLSSTLTNPVSGGSEASFVDGPLSKQILSGLSFNFPVGNYNGTAVHPARYGNILLSDVSSTGYWKSSYVNADPDPAYSRSNLLTPITAVSDNEYWIVERPSGNTAKVLLRWDEFSKIASVNSTRLAEWVTPDNRWEEKGDLISGTLTSGTVATSAPVTADNYIFTLGTTGVTAHITNVTPLEICNNSELITVTVLLTGTPNWTLTFNAGGNNFVQSGISSDTYNIQLTGEDLGGFGIHTIQLTAVSDALGTGIVDESSYSVTVKETFVPNIQGPFTVGTGEIRNFYTADNSGSNYLWTWQGTAGGTIATPNVASTDITMGPEGTYQLQITESGLNGCSASDIQLITIAGTPSPEITPTDANICVNEVVTYTTPFVTGHDYLWTITGGNPTSGIGNSITVTWNAVGNGSVSVAESFGAVTGTDIVNVVIDPQPVTNLTVDAPDEVCYGSSGVFVLNGSQSGFSYQLREGVNNSGIAVAGNGDDISLTSGIISSNTTFNVLVYNNGCSNQLLATPLVNILPAVTPPAFDLGTTSDRCMGAGTITYTAVAANGAEITYSLDAASLTGGNTISASTGAVTYVSGWSGTSVISATIAGCNEPVTATHTVTIEKAVTSLITGNATPACQATGISYSVVLTTGSDYDWTVPDGAVITSGANGPDNNQITVDFGTESGKVVVIETNQNGCQANPVELDIALLECELVADFSANLMEICAGDEVIFTSLSQGVNSTTAYQWNFGTAAVPAQATGSGPHTVTYPAAGLISVQLTISNGTTDDLLRSNYITVNSNPAVSLGQDTVVCGNNPLVIDAGDFSTYHWSTGANSSSITVYEGAGTISVTVMDENGCEGYDEIRILACDPETQLGVIPNTFTPNNDNYHDSWKIENIHLFPDADIQVFDRWGRLVFRSDGGYNNDWKGTGPNDKDLPVDTYYYLLDLKVAGYKPVTGTVNIIR